MLNPKADKPAVCVNVLAPPAPAPARRGNPQLLSRNVKRFRGGLVFKAHRLCLSLNSRLESNNEEEEVPLEARKGRIIKPACS